MDLALACRLEAAEGGVATSFIPVRQRRSPEGRFEWRDEGGAFVLFDGADSPMTQTFGLGTLAEATPARLAAIEAFFDARGADTMHEVSPLGGVEVAARLVERGYRPIEYSTVLVRALDPVATPASALRVRVMEPRDRAAWVDAGVEGWSDDPGVSAFMRPLAEVASENPALVQFLVERADGRMVATAALGIHADVALFTGASTIPDARGQGAQALLVAARFAEARRRGCALAMMVTAPGSTSQRNAERGGFRVAYTRTKWRRPVAR